MKEGKDRNKSGRILRKVLIPILIGIVLGFFIGYYYIGYLDEYYNGNSLLVMVSLYFSIALFLIMFFLHIIIHEGGHLIFGLLTGYTFISFRVASLTIVRENGKLTRKKYSIPGTAGQCLLAPPEKRNGEFPYQLYNYGGVILNIITSVLAILVLIFFRDMPLLVNLLLGCYAGAGMLLGLTNGIPLKASGIANDGYNVKSMRNAPLARDAFYLQLAINAKQSAGTRLKDMPKEWFILPEGSDLSNVLISFILFMQYYRHIDMLQFNEAEQCLNHFEPVLKRLPAAYTNMLNLERLFIKLVMGGSPQEADEYLTKEVKLLIKSAKYELNIKRVAYIYHKLYKKDAAAADKCYKEAAALLEKYPNKAEAVSNMMLMDYGKELEFNKDSSVEAQI